MRHPRYSVVYIKEKAYTQLNNKLQQGSEGTILEPTPGTIKELYDLFVELSKFCFRARRYEASFYALEGALNLALQLEQDQALVDLMDLALELHFAILEEHLAAPPPPHIWPTLSSSSPFDTFFSRLARRVERHLDLRKQQRLIPGKK